MAQKITIEDREFLPKIEADITQRFPLISLFLVFMLVLRMTFDVPLPDIVFILVSLLILFSIPLAILIHRLREKKPKTAINYYFGYLLFDSLLLALIISFVGGITWILPGIYLLYIITLFWLFPRFQAILLVGWINLLLILLVFGNYFGILPYFDIFLPEEKNPQHFPFVLTSTIIALQIIGFLGYSSDTFYRLLSQKIKELRKRGKELIQTKKFLQEEVRKRTQELQKERQKIAKAIEEKTNELEEKKNIIKTQVKELEKFHKIAVARELGMAEIKEKIEKLKGSKSKNE